MITQSVLHYDFRRVSWNPPGRRNQVLDPQFLLAFRAEIGELGGRIISHASGFGVAVTADGQLKAELRTDNDFRQYAVAFPLELIGGGVHDFAVLFDGVRFQILCDGVVMDQDFPENPPLHIYDRDVLVEIHSTAVKDFRFTNDLSGVAKRPRQFCQNRDIQFYTPYGHNTWAGDVTICHYRGRFHLFYLHDRRHHGSRNGKGAHEFWHLSTADFLHWQDHGAVVEIKAPWQAIGTGNAFEYQGKLHLTYGLHTERAVPAHKHTKQLFQRNLAQYGHTGLFHTSEVGTLLPHGASYVTSEDGENFTYSDQLMHYLVNPVVIPQEDGSLLLCQQGQWTSDKLGDWKLQDSSFPPYYADSFARNCLDCPAFFQIADWNYCMVGFTGFFAQEIGAEDWVDFTELGFDTYDGTNVPMTAWHNGRLIECGWMGGIGWGSCLLFREIIALGDGRLGKRWIAETLPDFDEGQILNQVTDLEEEGDWLFEFTVQPNGGEFVVDFCDKTSGRVRTFTLNPATTRAQWSESGRTVPTFREEVLASPDKTVFSQFTYSPHNGHDYAKENLILPDKPFAVRIILHNDPKLQASVLDAEIAGVHTMATMDKGFCANAVDSGGSYFLVKKATATAPTPSC